MSDVEEEAQALVCDIGTGFTKFGFAGDDAPRVVIPTIIGKPKHNINKSMMMKDAYVGDEANAKRGMLNITQPISSGLVSSWDDMEKLCHHIFYNELRIQIEEHSILMTERPLNPKLNREKMTQILFETFNVPSMYMSIDAVLALYASGRTTGIVLDSGYDMTYSTPIYEGYALPHAILTSNIGGQDITKQLDILLNKNKNNKNKNNVSIDIVNDIKEKWCYVGQRSSSYDCHNDKEYELPDGTKINISAEIRREATEILFAPKLIKYDKINNIDHGIDRMIYESIHKCDVDVRRDFYTNMILSGGNTMFEGIDARIQEGVRCLGPDCKFKVIASPERKQLTWIGGSILSSLSTFPSMWISKDEYDESGPSIIHRKCF